MKDLKLLALDADDLQIISAHMQDAVLRVADIAYLPARKRFAAVANRFNWEKLHKTNGVSQKTHERRRTALRFDRVLSAQIQSLPLNHKDSVLELLAIQYESSEMPEGHITLLFAGGSAIRLHVECIEAEMKDMGAAWETSNLPSHESTDTNTNIDDAEL